MMLNKMVFKKMLFPISTTALLSASASVVVAAAEDKKDEEKKELVRRKDLSIYPAKKEEKSAVKEESPEKSESALMSAVRQVRESLWSVNKQMTDITDSVNHVIETGKAHTSSTIQILREEENYPQRYGAIAAGGLVGFIVAIRRGWFRKIIYTGTGAAAVAAIAYPEEAREYSSEGFRYAKKYVIIAYHFINGDKKQGNDEDKKQVDGKKNSSAKPPKSKKDEQKAQKDMEPKPASFAFPDPSRHPAEQSTLNNMYSRRA